MAQAMQRLTIDMFTKFAERIAIIYDEHEISYQDFVTLIIENAQKLKQKNLVAGDNLLIYSATPDLIAGVFLGALNIGVVPGIIPAGLNEKQLNVILSQADAKLMLCDRNFAAQFRGIDKNNTKFLYKLPKLEQGEEFSNKEFSGKKFLVFAGATCEYPHWMLSDVKFLMPIAAEEKTRFNLADDDKIFCASGLSGVASLINGFLCPLLCGMTTIFANIWTPPQKMLNIIQTHKPKLILANLSQYQAMLKNLAPQKIKEAMNETQYFIAVGEALDIETANKWEEVTGLPLIEQPILLTGSRHADALAYASATDSKNEDLLMKHKL